MMLLAVYFLCGLCVRQYYKVRIQSHVLNGVILLIGKR
jgi:hypothetical protein